jgi:hypothetical protein
MAQHTGTPPRAGKPERRARGFLRAGGLIGTQMSTNAAKRGYAQARLRALWAEIAGPELATLCRPVRLASARGPAGGLLTLAVSGAHAPQVQMLLPVLRERVNAALGPGAVGRIQLTHAAGAFDEAPAAVLRAHEPAPDAGPLKPALSSIGDDELRGALETLARNVLSRASNE